MKCSDACSKWKDRLCLMSKPFPQVRVPEPTERKQTFPDSLLRRFLPGKYGGTGTSTENESAGESALRTLVLPLLSSINIFSTVSRFRGTVFYAIRQGSDPPGVKYKIGIIFLR